MTPESRDAIATIRDALKWARRVDGPGGVVVWNDTLLALDALEDTLLGEAEVRRNHLAYIGQLQARIAELEERR